MMRVFSILVLIAMIFGFLYWQIFAYRVPEPTYILMKKDHNIEIRKYSNLLMASVDVKGQQYDAITSGFKLLAGYIFGNNSAQQKISMTAPVMQSKKGDQWTVQFFMPEKLNKNSLPTPTDNQIYFNHIKDSRFIVIQFSGGSNQENLEKHLNLLIQYAKQHNISLIQTPIYAFYNPPWILPWWRKNEILFKIH